MNAIEYYELPYGVADRMELQNFLLADHYDGAAKVKAREVLWEPKSRDKMLAKWMFQLTHNAELTGAELAKRPVEWRVRLVFTGDRRNEL